jgi:hypothetical protein
MKKIVAATLSVFAITIHAEDKRVFSTDEVGSRQYNKPSFTIKDNGRVYETDSVGNRKYEGQSYKIENDRLYSTDTVGNKTYK